MSEKIKAIIGGFFIIVLFLVSSYFVRNNMGFVESFIRNDFFGVFAFVAFVIGGMIIAPISSMPLIPVASNLWGVSLTALILVFVWTAGSGIVFYISRRFGSPVVERFFSLEKIREIENKIPKEDLLFDLILLRIVVPVDILSYALGFLSKVRLRTFLLASFIGAIPMALFFSYLGTIPLLYQFIGFFILGFIVVFIQEYRKRVSQK